MVLIGFCGSVLLFVAPKYNRTRIYREIHKKHKERRYIDPNRRDNYGISCDNAGSIDNFANKFDYKFANTDLLSVCYTQFVTGGSGAPCAPRFYAHMPPVHDATGPLETQPGLYYVDKIV